MADAYDRLFSRIVDAVQINGAIGYRLALVIGECEAQLPYQDWERFRQLDCESDTGLLTSWLKNGLSGNILPTQTTPVFGLA